MAHNINFNKGKHSFVSKKEIAWHQLGTIVDTMTSKEAIELAGLDFEVEKRDLIVPHFPIEIEPNNIRDFELQINHKNYVNGLYSCTAVPDKYATVRTDNNCILGIVGSR